MSRKGFEGFKAGDIVRLREHLKTTDGDTRPWSTVSNNHGLVAGDLGVVTAAHPNAGFQVTFGRVGFIDTWWGPNRFDLVEDADGQA